jgi:hypothetical protein
MKEAAQTTSNLGPYAGLDVGQLETHLSEVSKREDLEVKACV